MSSLSDELMGRITTCTQAGDASAEQRQFATAIEHYEAALRLVPEPQSDWEATTWILVAIGDSRFLMGDCAACQRSLADAMHCPGALGNPFVHLRLGQSAFDLGRMEQAADELVRAYMGDGERVFEGEDPKYLELVLRKIEPAVSAAPRTKPWWKFW